MPNKSVDDMPDIRLREAIAVFLYGKDYTDDHLRSIAILGKGVWYRYPDKGTYARIGNQIIVRQPGRETVRFQ